MEWRGCDFEDCINEPNLAVLSTLSLTHLHFSYRTWLSFDLIIASASMAGSIHTYLHKDLTGNIHLQLQVLAILNIPNFTPQISKPRKNCQRTNWTQFTLQLQTNSYRQKLIRSSDIVVHSFSTWHHSIKLNLSTNSSINVHAKIPLRGSLVTSFPA